MIDLKFHELADIFPLLDGTDFDDLLKDIRQNGQAFPIIIHEGKILDGRNRYLACQKLEREPRCEEYTGSDPFQFAITANVHRRHLTISQRAMMASDVANVKFGEKSVHHAG